MQQAGCKLKRLYKILGTIGSFLTGYILGMIIYPLPIIGILMGLIVATWWYKYSPPVAK